ncbi:hypothetical protein ACHQM5_027334 [Ranunculus cassubicifolius]
MLRVLNRNSSLVLTNVKYPSQTQTCNVKYVWGSCDGLLCVTLKVTGCVVLWNPSTREYKKLPVALHNYEEGKRRYGIGYNPSSMDYEVVRIAQYCYSDSSSVQIYSLRNNSWRRSRGISYILYHSKSGVIIDGKLHLLATHGLKRYSCIIAYDYRDEKFQEVPLPEFEGAPDMRSITTLDGKLFLFLDYFSEYKGWVTKEGWVMKDYGSRRSWSKLFRIEAGGFGQIPVDPLFNTRQGDIVMRFGNSIVLYDPRDNNLSNVKMVVDVKGGGFGANMYTESLVSLGIESEIVGKTDSWAW